MSEENAAGGLVAVKMLTSIAGAVEARVGEVLHVAEAHAKAWVADGLAVLAPAVDVADKALAVAKGQIRNLEAELAAAQGEAEAARAEGAKLVGQVAELGNLRDDLQARFDALTASAREAAAAAGQLVVDLQAKVSAGEADVAELRRQISIMADQIAAKVGADPLPAPAKRGKAASGDQGSGDPANPAPAASQA